MNAQEIRDLFKRHNVPLSKDDVWEVQGNPVVKHQALERLSSALRINWHKPEVLRSERDEAVLIVTGNLLSGATEWSIGEAVVGQNLLARNKTAVYPYAMAEKRAKDRVILKLAGMYGSHSEEEADDFKQGAKPEELPSTFVTKGFDTSVTLEQFGAIPATKDSRSIYVENSLERIAKFESASELLNWAKTERQKVWPQYKIQPIDEDGQRIIKAYRHRMGQLTGEMQND